MSDVIAVRVPKKLKDELQELNIDYAEETRAHLEAVVKRKKLIKVMKDVDRFRNKLGEKTGVTTSSADIVREDREHAH
jgi:hypothetical protein